MKRNYVMESHASVPFSHWLVYLTLSAPLPTTPLANYSPTFIELFYILNDYAMSVCLSVCMFVCILKLCSIHFLFWSA